MSPHAETARHPTDVETVYAEFSQFFVCGDYVGLDTGRPMLAGSAYVERFRPVDVTRPYPIVLIHGGYQTGTNFTGTPDGRRGWAHDFLRAGYDVYEEQPRDR